MSAMGQKLTVQCKEACPLYRKSDTKCDIWNVRFGPIADIPRFTRSPRRYVEHAGRDGGGGEMFQTA